MAAASHADQFLSIPTAGKVPFGDVRLDMATAVNSAYAQAYADYGIGKSFETTLRFDRYSNFETVSTFDASYSFVSPITGYFPGISAGVMDALGETPHGRRYYAVVTWRQDYTTEQGDFPGDVSVGVFAGRRTSPLVGFDLPLSSYLHFVACHDGYNFTAGVELRRTKSLGLRFVTVGGRPQVGLDWLTKF